MGFRSHVDVTDSRKTRVIGAERRLAVEAGVLMAPAIK
jgi:hypothetical protein